MGLFVEEGLWVSTWLPLAGPLVFLLVLTKQTSGLLCTVQIERPDEVSTSAAQESSRGTWQSENKHHVFSISTLTCSHECSIPILYHVTKHLSHPASAHWCKQCFALFTTDRPRYWVQNEKWSSPETLHFGPLHTGDEDNTCLWSSVHYVSFKWPDNIFCFHRNWTFLALNQTCGSLKRSSGSESWSAVTTCPSTCRAASQRTKRGPQPMYVKYSLRRLLIYFWSKLTDKGKRLSDAHVFTSAGTCLQHNSGKYRLATEV